MLLRDDCQCQLPHALPGTLYRCGCGLWWWAGRIAWRPASRRRLWRRLRRQLRRDLAAFDEGQPVPGWRSPLR